MSKDFIAESIKLMLELLSDVFGFLKNGVAGDAFGLAATEVEEVVAGRMLLKDVGPIEFRMKVPYRREGQWVLRAVVAGEVGTIFGSEFDHPRVVKHS